MSMPKLSRTAPCRGCGKDIAFIRTKAGKSMPVDADAVEFIPAGGPNTYVMIDGSIQRGREKHWDDMENGMIGYRSHFATCPAADKFRNR